MQESDLEDIEELCDAATPGPWFMRTLDDDAAMSLVAISTSPGNGEAERWPAFNSGEIVAATLVQRPRYVSVSDHLWDENAAFIVMAREFLPQLVGEVRRLRLLLDAKTADNLDCGE